METLAETNRRQKSLHKFLGADKSIRNIGIISPENPMGKVISKEDNNRQVEMFKDYLKNTGTQYQRVKGMYNNLEHSFILFNVSKADLIFWGNVFKQESFIYGTFDEDCEKPTFNFEYYQKDSVNSPYKLKSEQKGFVVTPEATNYYTVISKDFKFNIPFKMFEECCYKIDRKFQYRKSQSEEYSELFESYLNRSMDDSYTPKSRMIAKAHLYGTWWTPYEGRTRVLKEEANFYAEDDLSRCE